MPTYSKIQNMQSMQDECQNQLMPVFNFFMIFITHMNHLIHIKIYILLLTKPSYYPLPIRIVPLPHSHTFMLTIKHGLINNFRHGLQYLVNICPFRIRPQIHVPLYYRCPFKTSNQIRSILPYTSGIKGGLYSFEPCRFRRS